ncbi:hypothetical protein KBX71_13460 [Micromonospora sp. D93]|uniref:hypothetical protein n=1 Tax=Micromonospora sp. D93 TaxID=2824886 RepID=UPI001B38CEE9|nr:hypothetical protein [Micromonospora sp. D93]MBQ1018864.1 hypothetical protein [Micromonospora sp. D93]
MAAEAPLARAAARIRAAAEAKRSGFAGVALRQGVVTVYWKGKIPADMRRVLAQEGGHVPLTVEPARHSADELAHAASKVRASTDRSVKSVAYTVRGDGLTVTVSTAAGTPPRLPSLDVPVEVLREPALPARSGSAGKGSSTPTPDGFATAAVAWPSPSRQDDTTPAWGGAHLINSNASNSNGGWSVRLDSGEVVDADAKWHCTSGIPVLDEATNTELMVGPASCGTPSQTYVDPSGDVVNETAGANAAWHKPSRGVTLIKPKGGADPAIYDGTSWTQDGWQIDAWESPIAGQHVCVSGAETGTFCDVEMTEFVGGNTVWIEDYKGDLVETNGVSVIRASINEPNNVDPDKRSYILKDGSPCNGFDFYEEYDNLGCLVTAFGYGDMGGAVFTIPSEGPGSGILIKGLIARIHGSADENPFNYDVVGIDKIAAAYPSMTALTVDNDRR